MWDVPGQEALVKQLDRALREGRIPHAYLLVGPPQVGQTTLAQNIAQAVNCLAEKDRPCHQCNQCRRIAAGKHADVTVIALGNKDGEGPRKEISIQEVRQLQQQASLMPYEGRWRVFIIDGAERMSEEAANALLKTLEEPPPQVLFLLLTAQEEAVLPTVRSRCQRLELRPVPHSLLVETLVKERSLDPAQADRLARLAQGRPGWALAAAGSPDLLAQRAADLEGLLALHNASLEQRFSYAAELASAFSKDRESAKERLQLWLQWWRDVLLVAQGAGAYVHNADRMEDLKAHASRYSTAQAAAFAHELLATLEALDANASPLLALEVLMLNLPRGKDGRAS